jgi:hypothetical protein
MSEKTTIGGTVYESLGSSSSNLLLKCNGTARIQWGNKLIDIIKNGKLALSDSSNNIYIVQSEEEIKKDGIYIISKDNYLQLWICKDSQHYNILGTDLYLSTSNVQELTSEQKSQILSNLGLVHLTLSDLKNANLLNGFAYVLETKSLYSITNGIIEELVSKNNSKVEANK